MRSRSNTSESGRSASRSRRPSDGGERRWNERVYESAVGVITYQGARCSTTCSVLDISVAGARLELDLEDWVNPISSAGALPIRFKLIVAALGFEADCHVAWRGKALLGVRFVGKVRPLARQFRRRRAF
jgi:hypothetical protein